MANLNEQQKYLIGRLPGRYDIKQLEVPDPAPVKAARKLIEAHEKKVGELRCEHAKRYDKAVIAAREAIYFRDPLDALAAVKSLELDFPKKYRC